MIADAQQFRGIPRAEANRSANTNGRKASSGVGRTPPHSIEAEEYLLSCCLLDGRETVARCLEGKLSADAFYSPANRLVFEKLTEFYSQGAIIDLARLAEELKTSKQLDEIGGYAFLTQISGRIPTTAQAGYFIEKVRELYLVRQLLSTAIGTVESCHAYDGSLDDLLVRVRGQFEAICEHGSRSQHTLWDRVSLTRVNPAKEPPEPRDVFSIGGKPVARGGNLVVIASLPGEGKSTMIQAALAAKMASPDNCIDSLGWAGTNSDGALVLHLDTEQEARDHWNLVRRAMRRANVQELPSWLHSYNVLGFKRTERLDFLREWVKRHKGQRIDSILIDGAADLVLDVNDPTESFSIVDELHQIVTTTGAAMVAVIHLNPGQNSKTRGHFGSEMQRKAHSQIELRRDGDETIVKHVKGRHGHFQDYRFTWSENQQMHVSAGRYVDPQLVSWRDALFADDTLVGANEAIRRIEDSPGQKCSNGTAKARWRKIIASGIVTKTSQGIYTKCI